MLRKWIAKGYRPISTHAVPLTCIWRTTEGLWVRTALGLTLEFPGTRAVGGIALVCPTYVGRASLAEHAQIVGRLADQLKEITAAFFDFPVTLVVGMQWRLGEEAIAMERLEALGRMVTEQLGIHFIGLSLPGPGKVSTLNAAIRVSASWNLLALAWIDDDVYVTPGSMKILVQRFLQKGCRGAVGAKKIGLPKATVASRVLFQLKRHTAPACNYPHGCCILVERRILCGGFPDRYICDEGYVCFELLDPASPNPLKYLELVPEAKCWYYIGGDAGQTIHRIRRMLLNHHIFLADYPKPVAHYYFSRLLFYGLWPLTPWHEDEGVIRGCGKWVLKFVYFLWFSKIGVELFLRGLFHRPLKGITWGSYTDFRVLDENRLETRAIRQVIQ